MNKVILALGFVLLAGCQTIAVKEIDVSPSFTGVIRTEFDPITVRYRDFPKSNAVLTRKSQTFLNGKLIGDNLAKGDAVISSYSVGDISILSSKMSVISTTEVPEKSKSRLKINVDVHRTRLGHITNIDLDVRGKGVTDEVISSYEELFRHASLPVPEYPVSTGSRIYDAEVDIKNMGIKMRFLGDVLGVSYINSRTLLVIRIHALAKLKNGLEMKLEGYELLDSETGAAIRRDFSTHVSGLVKGKKFKSLSHQIEVMSLVAPEESIAVN